MTDELQSSWAANAITVIVTIIICVIFTVRLEGRIEVNSVDIEHNAQQISEVKDRTETQYSNIMRLLEKINEKLDKKADK